MCSLVDDIVLDSGQPVEDDGTSSTLHIEQRLAGQDCTTGRDGRDPVHDRQSSGDSSHFFSRCGFVFDLSRLGGSMIVDKSLELLAIWKLRA